MKKSGLWTAVLVLCSATSAQSADPIPFVVADIFTIHSQILKEDRRLYIYNPESIGGNVLPAYPVLYLLEENDMPMVAGMVKYLSAYNEQLPAFLIVGIDGGSQRIADLTPTHSLYDNLGNLDTDPRSWLQPSGGGDRFLQFVKDEVMPFVEKRYATAPFKILAGHSVGGLAAIHALTTHRDMFNAYLAVSPSLWWDKGSYMRTAVQRLPDSGPNEFLFLADCPETGPFPFYIKGFLDALGAQKRQSLRWLHTYYPGETHGSIAAKAYYDGLRFLYPEWNVPEEGRSAATIKSHYRDMSARLGYDVQPPYDLVSDWADDFTRKGKTNDAIEVAGINVANFPMKAWSYSHLGDIYLQNGDRASAAANYMRALKLAPEDVSLKTKLEGARP